MSLTRIFVAALILSACAQGAADTDTGGTEPKKSTNATDPGSSVTVPSKNGNDPSDPPPDTQDPPADDDASTPPPPPKTDSGSPPPPPADAGSSGTCTKTPPSNACGLSPQCGCTASQTCDITNKSTGGVACVNAGAGAASTACTATSQCAAGLTCAYGACRPYCSTTCTGGTVCEDWYEPAGTLVPNGKVCSITCDPRTPSAACGANTCIWDSSAKVSDCDKAGSGAMYDPCSAYNDCKAGLACINHPVFGFECEKWCRLGQSDCSYPDTCTDVYGTSAPTSGGAKLGHCQ